MLEVYCECSDVIENGDVIYCKNCYEQLEEKIEDLESDIQELQDENADLDRENTTLIEKIQELERV